MPDSSPSLFKIVSDGGVLMGPFLVVAFVWIVCTVRYVLTKDRSPKALAGLLLFPIAFGLLAVFHGYLHAHAQLKAMERSGFPDALEAIRNGLVVTRSGMVIAACGCVSGIVTGLLFLLPTARERNNGPGSRD